MIDNDLGSFSYLGIQQKLSYLIASIYSTWRDYANGKEKESQQKT